MASDNAARNAKEDLSSSLAKIIEQNPGFSKEQAWHKLRDDMLANNPFVPPKDGCPVNKLPPELLAAIFRVGKQMQEEEHGVIEDEDEEADGYKDIIDTVWDEKDLQQGDRKEISTSDLLVDAPEGEIPVDDGDEEWEDSDMHDSEQDDDESEAELPFQVLVSHICKLWRSVALGTPSLWTTLTFSENPQFEKSRAYIERAKGSPLDIAINASIPEGYDESDHPDHPDYSGPKSDDENGTAQRTRSRSAPPRQTDDANGEGKGEDKELEENEEGDEDRPFLSQKEVSTILDIICPVVSQWREFEFNASLYSYIYLLLERLESLPAAPILEVLQIYHYEDCEEYETFSPAELGKFFLPFNGNIPRLKVIGLWGVHFDWDKSISFLQGLNDLELAYHAKDVRPSWSTFSTIISNCPELRTLSLCLSGPASNGTDDEWTPSPLEIPSLKDLVLCYHDPQYAIALIKNLSFPNVHSLALDYEEQDYSDFAKQLSIPLKGKSKSILSGLQHLKIAGLPCSDRAVDGVYEQLAGLNSLNLDCEYPPQEIWFEKLIDPYATSPEGEEENQAGPSNAVSGPSSTATTTAASSSAPSSSGPKIYCPQLETLTVNGISGDRLKLLVQKRKEIGHPLKRMCIPEEAEVDEEDEDWLKQNLESLEYFEPSDYDTDEDMEIEIEEGLDTDEDDEDDVHMLF